MTVYLATQLLLVYGLGWSWTCSLPCLSWQVKHGTKYIRNGFNIPWKIFDIVSIYKCLASLLNSKELYRSSSILVELIWSQAKLVNCNTQCISAHLCWGLKVLLTKNSFSPMIVGPDKIWNNQAISPALGVSCTHSKAKIAAFFHDTISVADEMWNDNKNSRCVFKVLIAIR